MKPLSTSPVKLLHRHFELFLFAAALLLEFHIFHTARAAGLLAPPMPGMDQHTILQAALALPSGVLPEPGSYLYSPLYTLWLGGLAALTGGNQGAMRLLQGALAALIPAVIYRTGRKAGIGRSAAEIGAILYLFCGSALLIALDFLRATPLALLFLLFYNCLLGAWRSGTLRSWFLAGLCAGGCMLGRENFIAVALLPAIFLFAPSVRKRLTPGNAASAVAGSLLVLAPVLLYHLVTCGSPAILPGNGANVFRFFQGEEALADPLLAARRILMGIPGKICDMASPFEMPNSLSIYAHREFIPLLKILALPMPLLMGAALIGTAGFRRNGAVLLAALLVAGYFGSIVFCDIYYRFRIPAEPLLAMLAGAGIRSLIRFRARKEYAALAAGIALLAAGVGWTIATPPEPRLPASERDATVRLLTELDRFSAAEHYLERARKHGAPMPAGEQFLIRTLARAGRHAEAQELFRRWHKHWEQKQP